MKLTLRLSASLLSVYREAGQPLPENISMEAEGPLTIAQILARAGINPLLSPLISVDGTVCTSLEQLIVQDSVLTLIGPLQGG